MHHFRRELHLLKKKSDLQFAFAKFLKPVYLFNFLKLFVDNVHLQLTDAT